MTGGFPAPAPGASSRCNPTLLPAPDGGARPPVSARSEPRNPDQGLAVRRPRSPARSLNLAMVRAVYGALGPLVPGLLSRWALRQFMATRRYPSPAREQRWRAGARRAVLACPGGEVVTYAWGDGPTVLLVHGWNGRAGQLGGLGEALARAGRRAVAFDAPGHGESSGRHTSLFQILEVIQALDGTHGPFQGVIAHSFGVACATAALGKGLRAGRAVCLSPPARMAGMVDAFADFVGLPQKVRRALERRMEKRFGPGLWAVASPETAARTLDTPALIIHDRDDREVPWEQGERVANAWPGACLMTTRGLGHRRILRDRDVIRRCTDFITGAPQ